MFSTVAISPSHSSAKRVITVPAQAWAVLAIVVAAFILRFGQFGNAIAGLDEQFYLLVGDRMWAGELPYVDIWDRKPLGLFALFAAIRLLPGDGVLAAQLVATVFAAATAVFIALFARRWVGWMPATLAGVFYLAGLNELWGETTQTPIFYNALVAAAALLTVRVIDSPVAYRRSAYIAIGLMGLAVQIKTNAALQGSVFGLWLLFAAWQTSGSWAVVARRAAVFALLGLLPTLLAFGFYIAIGHGDSWWQANVLSILAKGAPQDAAAGKSLLETLILFVPCGLVTLLGLWTSTKRFTLIPADMAFVLTWIAVSVADFVAIGGYYPHYAIPLMLSCCPLMAQTFSLAGAGRALFALSLVWPTLHAVWFNPTIARIEQGYVDQVMRALPEDVRTRCLFIYEGPVAYYRLTEACRLSRYAFTAHLSSQREAPSLGVEPSAELDRVMTQRPGTVITVENSSWPDRNLAIERQLMRYLAAHYRITARLPYRHYAPESHLLIWRLRYKKL